MLFQLYIVASSAFLELRLPVLCTIILPSQYILSHLTMVIWERRVKHIAMTIIKPWKEIGRVGDQTSDLLFSSPLSYQLRYKAPLRFTMFHCSDINWTWVDEDTKDRLCLQSKDDGEFWMSYKDFCRHFSEVTICLTGPDFDGDGVIDQAGWWKSFPFFSCIFFFFFFFFFFFLIYMFFGFWFYVNLHIGSFQKMRIKILLCSHWPSLLCSKICKMWM